MKRKTILAIVAVVAVVLTWLQTQFGLAINAAEVVGGIGIALLYILFEAKRDIAAVHQQSSKWTDPKFWLALVAALIPVVNEQFGLNLPAEIILTVIGFILALLFKTKVATEPS